MPSLSLFSFYSYATEGDIRIPKIYTKTGDKGCVFLTFLAGKKKMFQTVW